MRIIATVLNEPSMWTKQEQVLLDVARMKEAEAERKELLVRAAEEKGTGTGAAVKQEETGGEGDPVVDVQTPVEDRVDSEGAAVVEPPGIEGVATSRRESTDTSGEDLVIRVEGSESGRADPEVPAEGGADETLVSPLETPAVEAAEQGLGVSQEQNRDERDELDEQDPNDSVAIPATEGDSLSTEAQREPVHAAAGDEPDGGLTSETVLVQATSAADDPSTDPASTGLGDDIPAEPPADEDAVGQVEQHEQTPPVTGSEVPKADSSERSLAKVKRVVKTRSKDQTRTDATTSDNASKPSRTASIGSRSGPGSTSLGSSVPGSRRKAALTKSSDTGRKPLDRKRSNSVDLRTASSAHLLRRDLQLQGLGNAQVGTSGQKFQQIVKDAVSDATSKPADGAGDDESAVGTAARPIQDADKPIVEAEQGKADATAVVIVPDDQSSTSPPRTLTSTTAEPITAVADQPSTGAAIEEPKPADSASGVLNSQESPLQEIDVNTQPTTLTTSLSQTPLVRTNDDQARALEAEAAKKKAADLDHAKRTETLETNEARRARDPEFRQAADAFSKPITLEEMAKKSSFRFLQAHDRASSALKKGTTEIFNVNRSHGLSQTVVYSSGFVDTLSEITADMGISAALTIKTGKIDGSGRGSFIDTDKFKDSDLRYWISVKVVNQTINFKDPLVYNQLDNVSENEFRDVFGDCFISGFIEGGEFNALVTMKVLNKNKAQDIKAEAAVTVGDKGLDAKVEGNLAIAKANLSLNTETTIQVSWQGGGIIKPPEEAWTLESLTRAAARFPDHVAVSPQRTHAILTKYETLRSFHQLKPAKLSPINYENATLYAAELMETFMTYKSLYQRLTLQIGNLQAGSLRFKDIQKQPVTDGTGQIGSEQDSLGKKQAIDVFPATIDGLDDARQKIRHQMNMIINVVETIGNHPEKVSDPEPFISPIAFETLLPIIESPDRFSKKKNPLSGVRMYDNKPATDGEPDRNSKAASDMCYIPEQVSPTPTPADKAKEATAGAKLGNTPAEQQGQDSRDRKDITLTPTETQAIAQYLDYRSELKEYVRLTPAVANANSTPGTAFSALDFMQRKTLLQSLEFYLDNGVICGILCRYANGLSWRRGKHGGRCKTVSLQVASDERITSASLTIGKELLEDDKGQEHVIAIRLHKSSGQSVLVQSTDWRRGGVNRRIIQGRPFKDVRTVSWESPLDKGYLVGFWGFSREQGRGQGIFRLGLVWADSQVLYEAK